MHRPLPYNLFLAVVALATSFTSGLAFAQNTSPGVSDEIIQNTRSEMRSLIDEVDELLGGTRSDDNRSSSTLRLTVAGESSRDTPKESPSLDAKLILKIGKLSEWKYEIKNWFSTKIHKWKSEFIKKEDSVIKTSNIRSEHQSESQSSSRLKAKKELHLKNEGQEKDPWKFSLQKHFKLNKDPSLWIHARVRKDFEYDQFLNTFATEIGWSTNNKWESNLEFITSTQLARKWSFNFSNTANWALTDTDFSSSHGPSVSCKKNDKELFTLSYSVALNYEDDKSRAESYSINGGYRLSAWRDLVYISLSPFLRYTRQNNFQEDPGVSGSLEAVF